jgi:large subunit ribosomal protein L4
MKIDVITQSKEKVKNIELSSSIFEAPINEHLVHEVITSYFSNARAGTKGHKNRSTAKGGGSKPWRQKGTGRARAGTIRSPLWVGGGRAFSSSNSNYSKKINKKVFKYALKSIFSTLAKDNRLIIIDKISLKEPKTKSLVQILSKLELENVLIIQKELENNLNLASRNIPNVDVVNLGQINPVNLISFDYVLMESKVLSDLERKLQ